MTLLDTHVWLWWLLGSARLLAKERAALDRLASRGALRLAAVSLSEAQMLHATGRLVLDPEKSPDEVLETPLIGADPAT